VNTFSAGRSGFSANIYDFAVKSSGNVLIGSNTDNGTKFQVTGNSYFNGTVQISGLPSNNTLNSMLVMDASGNLGMRDVSTLANSTSWNVAGNSGTTPSTQFVGTTDNQRLAFRTNNIEGATLMAGGNFLIGGTADNGNKLQVYGNSYFNGNFSFMNLNSYSPGTASLVSSPIHTDGRWGLNYTTSGYSTTYPFVKFQGSFIGMGSGSTPVNINLYGLNSPLVTATDGVHLGSLIMGFINGPQNVSRLRMSVSDIGEINNYGSAYNSGVNYFQLETELLGAATAANTGQTAVRAPFLIGGYYLRINTGATSTEAARFDYTGNLGLGTTAPTAKLHVNGTVRFAGLTTISSPVNVLVSDASGNVFYATPSSLGTSIGSVNAWAFNGSAVSSIQNIGTTTSYDLPFITANTERMRIKSTGNIIINSTTDNGSLLQVNGTGYFSSSLVIGATPGTATSPYALAVNGSAVFTKAVVKLNSSWPDYVFSPAYSQLSLDEVERYVNQNRHLPDIPSTAEVEKDGIDLGSNQALLLKKIEELTLYAIEQNKKAEQQDKKIKELEKKLDKISAHQK
jgi:hypothetical protein